MSEMEDTTFAPKGDKTFAEKRRAPLSQLFEPLAEPETPEAIGATVTVTIDGIETKVPFGSTILEAAKAMGCAHPHALLSPGSERWQASAVSAGGDRGQRTLQAACAYPSPRRSRSIRTPAPCGSGTAACARPPPLRALRRLLLVQGQRQLRVQSLAEEYGVDKFRFGAPGRAGYPVDDFSDSVVRDMNKCSPLPSLRPHLHRPAGSGRARRPSAAATARVSTFMDKPLADVVCINCGQCSNRCPDAAPSGQRHDRRGLGRHRRPGAHVVIQTAPRRGPPSASASACRPGRALTFELNTALRGCGFNKVFDTNLRRRSDDPRRRDRAAVRLHRTSRGRPDGRAAAVHQLLARLDQVPRALLPRILPNLSTAKSPQQMFGALLKTYYARAERARSRRRSSRWRSCPARRRSSSATGRRCTPERYKGRGLTA